MTEKKHTDKELKKKLKQKEALCHEYLNDLKRLKAEFENYKKRIEKERADFVDLATSGLVKRLLPVLDDFERAIESAKIKSTTCKENSEKPASSPSTALGINSVEKLLEGLNLVYSHFVETLKQEGLKEIEAEGAPFDPQFHEAVLQVKAKGGDDGKVVEVMRKGYMLKDQVIRPAMVKVAKHSS